MRLQARGGTADVDDVALERWLLSPDGPVRRDLDRRAAPVFAKMVATCPKRTGRLVGTARRNRGETTKGPHVDVLIGHQRMTPYLGYLLHGTPAHAIAARHTRPNPHLRFMVGGRVVFAKRVWHPGTKGHDFVTASLDAAQ